MAKATSKTSELEKYIAHYPEWAKNFARKYFTKTINQFILYGNVRDLVPAELEDGTKGFIPLRDFLVNDLFASRDIIVFFDRSGGIHFSDPESRKDFNRALSGFDSIAGTEYAQKLPKDPVRVFAVLENYFRLRLSDNKRIACIIDYAETIIPMAEASQYSTEDRNSLVFLQKWAHDPLFLKKDFTVVMMTENLRDLSQQLIQSPYNAELKIVIPQEEERLNFIRHFSKGKDFSKQSDVTQAALAKHTAGVNYIQMRSLLADVFENKNKLTFEQLSTKKKEIIEAEAYGMLEFVETDFDLDLVAGHGEAKKHLREAAKALQSGRPDVMPMGYLIAGPVGTGKTFIITCFAGELGIPMVKLKNFRSQWQGVTEGNLEKILSLLQAMTPVAVMIDEADAALGNRDASGDSGVSARVFGQIASFMSDSNNRGKIIWFLVTARPDLMPIDLKRQGRAEEHLALFYPETQADRRELLKVMMKKTKIKLALKDVPEALYKGERAFSGAEMEAIMTRAKFLAVAEATGKEKGVVNKDILTRIVDDFIPPTYPMEIELQNLVAVMECTSRKMLPTNYREMDREDVVRRVDELKQLVR